MDESEQIGWEVAFIEEIRQQELEAKRATERGECQDGNASGPDPASAGGVACMAAVVIFVIAVIAVSALVSLVL